MTSHPDVVPGEHAHGEEKDARIEELLARALEQLPDLACEGGNEAGAGNAGDHPIAHPEVALRHAFGCSEHDADDESCLDNLAENY